MGDLAEHGVGVGEPGVDGDDGAELFLRLVGLFEAHEREREVVAGLVEVGVHLERALEIVVGFPELAVLVIDEAEVVVGARVLLVVAQRLDEAVLGVVFPAALHGDEALVHPGVGELRCKLQREIALHLGGGEVSGVEVLGAEIARLDRTRVRRGVCRQAPVMTAKISVKCRFILGDASVRWAPFMGKSRFGLVLLLALVGGQEARAQFANRRIGFELGGFTFNDREVTAGLSVQLEGTFYIENGFDVGLRIPATLLLTRQANKQLFGTGGQLYARYLFSEETLRPYAGLAIYVLVIIRGSDPANPDSGGNQQVFFGPQAFAGIQDFPIDTVSIGARGFFTLYFAVNNSNAIRPGGGGFLNVHFYFELRVEAASGALRPAPCRRCGELTCPARTAKGLAWLAVACLRCELLATSAAATSKTKLSERWAGLWKAASSSRRWARR